MAECFTAFATSWRPDAVVYDYLFPAAAATVAGVPAVRHDLGFTDIAPLHAVMVKHMSVPMGEVLSLDVAPPSMVGGASRGWPPAARRLHRDRRGASPARPAGRGDAT